MTCYTLAGGWWPEMDRATDYREKPLATSFLFSRSLSLYRSDLLRSMVYILLNIWSEIYNSVKDCVPCHLGSVSRDSWSDAT